MIDKNGIKALSDYRYDYYKLLKPFGLLPEGAIFVHDPDDDIYGSIAQGCLKLCWTPKGSTYGSLCANTVFLHYSFSKDEELFKLVKEISPTTLKKIKILEQELYNVKKELGINE